MTEKIDFRKSLKQLYAPSSKDFSLVEVPPMNFLMVHGQGDPNTSKEYQDAVEALYSLSYTLKFASKKQLQKDYTVTPLEGLWWADDMNSFMTGKKSDWKWTAMIMQPDWITSAMITAAREEVAKKKDLPALKLVREEKLQEGLSAQILHIGPYADEAPTLKRLHTEYLPENKLKPNGKHHEIYLSDPRKTAATKLKTILRQPVIAV